MVHTLPPWTSKWRSTTVNVSVDTSGRYIVVQAEKDRTVTGTVTAEQANAASLKVTATQAEKDRTITGSVTANPTPFSTQLASVITLTDADQDYLLPAAEQSGRIALAIYNISDTTVYVGGSGVETTDGIPIATTKYMVIPASENVYAVCGSAGKILRLLECK